MMVDQIVSLGREALLTTMMVSAVPLLVAAVVSIIMSMLQTVTQIQDPAITTVPKIAAVLVAVLICLPWLLQTMVDYVTQVYSSTPAMLGTG